MNLDDALLWLNDRLGENITAEVTIHVDDSPGFCVLAAKGPLRHWTDGAPELDDAPMLAELRGRYYVGGCALDLSHVSPVAVEVWPVDGTHLTVFLDQRTTLEISA